MIDKGITFCRALLAVALGLPLGDVPGDWEKFMVGHMLVSETAVTLHVVSHLDSVVLIPDMVEYMCTLGEIPTWILYLSEYDASPLRCYC